MPLLTGFENETENAAQPNWVDARIAEILARTGVTGFPGAPSPYPVGEAAQQPFGEWERADVEDRLRRRRERLGGYAPESQFSPLMQALSGAGSAIGPLAGQAWQGISQLPGAKAVGDVAGWAGGLMEQFGEIDMRRPARDVAGWELYARENAEGRRRLEALAKRLAQGDESVLPEAKEIEDRLQARYDEESNNARAYRNPELANIELPFTLAQAAAATMIAPGIGAGLGRNLLAAAIDPTGQALSVGLEGTGKVGGALARALAGSTRGAPTQAGIVGGRSEQLPPWQQRLRGQEELPFEGEAAPIGVPDYARLGREASERAWEAGRAERAAEEAGGIAERRMRYKPGDATPLPLHYQLPEGSYTGAVETFPPIQHPTDEWVREHPGEIWPGYQLEPEKAKAARQREIEARRKGGPRTLRETLAGPPEETARKRYYHGTSADFFEPEPSKFDPDAMYGPGYYLTDNPEVAGGYATARADALPGNAAIPKFRHDYLQNLLSTPRGSPAEREAWTKELADLRDTLDRFRPATGPNIRPVDVAENARLLDTSAPAPPELVDAARRYVAGRYSDLAYGAFEPVMPENPTGEDILKYLGQGKASADALSEMGYDGIRYPGGQIMPITDAAGKPIEHDALAIFKSGLGKLTNPLSGGHGLIPRGDTLGPAALRGALYGGTSAGYAAQQEGASPTDIAGAGLLGALGGAGLHGTGAWARRALGNELPSNVTSIVGRNISRAQQRQAGQAEMALEGAVQPGAGPVIPPAKPIPPEAIDSAIASVKALVQASDDPAEIADLTTKLERLEELRFGKAVNVAMPDAGAVGRAQEAGYDVRAGAVPQQRAPAKKPPSSARSPLFRALEGENVPTAEAVAAGAKEPWQITREEAYATRVPPQGQREGWKLYQAEQGYHGNPPTLYAESPNGLAYTYDNNFHAWILDGAAHQRAVADAVALGKPVPQEVLAEYPDLAQMATKAQAQQPPIERVLAGETPETASPLGRTIGGPETSHIERALSGEEPTVLGARKPSPGQIGFGGEDWSAPPEPPVTPREELPQPAKTTPGPRAPEPAPAGTKPEFTSTNPDGTYRSGPVGLDIGTSMLRQMIDTQYEGSLPRIVAKELVQNAFDISREAGTPVTVNISMADKSIDVFDKGAGMGPGVVQHVFLNVGESLKPEGASGGKGTAKVAFLGNARRFYLHTVGKDADVWGVTGYDEAGQPIKGLIHKGDGKVKESILVGSRDELLAKKTEVLSFPPGKMPESVRNLLPEDMRDGLGRGKQTGTEIRVQPLDAKWDYGANSYVESWADMFVSNREHMEKGEPVVKIAIDGKPVTPGSSTYVKYVDGGPAARLPTPIHLDTIQLGPSDTPTARLDIWASNEVHDSSNLTYILANRGQPQEAKNVYVSAQAKIPQKLWINVEPLDKSPDAPQRSGYPWTANRTDLIPEINQKLRLYFEDKLVEKSKQQGIRLATDALGKRARFIANPQGGRTTRLVDATGSIPDKVLDRVASRSYTQSLANTLWMVHDDLLSDLKGHSFTYAEHGSYTVARGEFMGLGISNEFNGLNVRAAAELGTVAPQVLVNPWTLYRSVSVQYPDLDADGLASRLATRLLSTTTHEISHHAVPTDQSPFGWAMTYLEGLIDEKNRAAQHARLRTTLAAILGDDRTRKEFMDDAAEIRDLAAKENVLKKWAADQPAADIAANPENAGGRGGTAAGPPGGRGLPGRRSIPGGDAVPRGGPRESLRGGRSPALPQPAVSRGAPTGGTPRAGASVSSPLARAIAGEGAASPMARALRGRKQQP